MKAAQIRVLAVAGLFGLTIVLLLTVSVLSWLSRSSFDSAQSQAIFYRLLDRNVTELDRLILSAGWNRKQFLLTGENRFSRSYQRDLEQRKKLVRTLEESLAKHPGLKSQLADLTMDLTDRKEAIASFGPNQPDDENFVLHDKISTAVSKIRDEIEQFRVDAEQSYRSQAKRTGWLMNLAAGSALAAGMVGVALLFGHLNATVHEAEMERQKQAAEESDREKSKFLASMNHEIRTPLNAMLGFTELLQTEVTSERGKRFLLAVQKSGESLTALINDILDLAKIESGSFEIDEEPVRIDEFIRSIELLFEKQSSEKNLRFRIDVDDSVPEVLTFDGLRVRQILVNLIGNAIKFTSSGSIVTRLRTDSGNLIIEVEDTGCGIEKEKQAVIFQPFQQAKSTDEMKGGTGLGLSICRELVTLMDGTIELRSEPGKGSLFRVSIPAKATQKDIPAVCLPDEERSRDFARLKPSRLLVADDNAENRDLIAGIFEQSGHSLVFAKDGRQAMAKLNDQPFDLVLMDIRMPVMNGEEALREIRKNPELSEIPVIAVTASSLQGEKDRLSDLFDGYVRKPFTGATLYSAVKTFIGLNEGKDNSKPAPKTSPQPSQPNPELRAELERYYDQHWQNLAATMVYSEVRQTGGTLEKLAAEHSCERLRSYAETMRELTEKFDQQSLEQHLKRFPELIASL